MALLEQINSPIDLRKLEKGDLTDVCSELRQFILDVISKKGGHLASSLGTVELTVALHYVFETPQSKIVWDVGHQAYGHKVLTGRRNKFDTVRQWEGLSGFTSREESEYDHFGAGHASTSISAAIGIGEALRISGQPHFGIAVVGDGSMTGGLAYEAMNNAGQIPAKNLLVVFNDNDMSIDPNVGGLNKFINRTVTHPGYSLFRKELVGILDGLSETGIPVKEVASRIRKSVKDLFTPGDLFECFGFRYLGPIDGHNVDEVVETLNFVKNEGPQAGPFLVHAVTKKGRGYERAENMPVKYHGVGQFDLEQGIQSKPKKVPNYQDVFADTLIGMAKKDPRILAITAAMPSGTGLVKFQKEFPSRCYDVGIAESHAVLFAAGLATEGYRPVAAIYSTFLQRAYDQLIHDVSLQNLPVIFALDRGGLVGADGATHQGIYDLSYLRSIPNFVVMAPKDENELQHMIKTSVDYQAGPIAIRYPRGPVVGIEMDKELKNLPIGKGEVVHADAKEVDVLLLGIGYSVQEAIHAQKILAKEGLKTALINARFVKPLDSQLLSQWVPNAKLVVSIEENNVKGGFGSAVLEWMAENDTWSPSLQLGVPDRIIDHGSQSIQREFLQIDSHGIARQVLEKFIKIEPSFHPLMGSTHLGSNQRPLQPH